MNSIFTPFPDTLWVRKEIKFGYSCSLCQILHLWYRQSSFLHSATPRARDGLSVSLMQDFAEKALVPKLDSYNHGTRFLRWRHWDSRILTMVVGFVSHCMCISARQASHSTLPLFTQQHWKSGRTMISLWEHTERCRLAFTLILKILCNVYIV